MKRYQALSDDQLLNLLRQDDGLALSELYCRYWDKLLSVAFHRLQDPDLAKEAVQDVFFSLWKRRETIELKFSLGTYLAVAIKYRIINVMDHGHRMRAKEATTTPKQQYAFSPEAYVIEKELWERIEAIVRQLPQKCQVVFMLSRKEGLSNKQIAEKLEVAEKTVEGHITSALHSLRGNLTLIAPPLLLLILGQADF